LPWFGSGFLLACSGGLGPNPNSWENFALPATTAGVGGAGSTTTNTSATGSDGTGGMASAGETSGGINGRQPGRGSGTGSSGGVTPPGGGGYASPPGPIDFGPNVIVFSPEMGDAAIQSKMSGIFATQETNQFGTERYAYLFKPG